MALFLTAGPPKEWAYVLISAVFSVYIHNGYLSSKVMAARKKYNVPYPDVYAPPSHPHAHAFNCVQRGAMNAIELSSGFYLLYVLNALRWPLATAILGAIYSCGRILYFQGYATGRPEARYKGALQYAGLVPLFVMPLVWAGELLLK